MLSMITRRKTLVKGHDPRNAAISIILSILITTFLLASASLLFGVNDGLLRGANAAQGATVAPRYDTAGMPIKDESNRRLGFLLMSVFFLFASIPPVLAFVGIEKHSPKLLIPMIVFVYSLSAIVHLGSAAGFVYLLCQNQLDLAIIFAIALLGLGANLVFFCIGAINRCAFYHTYTFLKEPIRVNERVDIEETPIVS